LLTLALAVVVVFAPLFEKYILRLFLILIFAQSFTVNQLVAVKIEFQATFQLERHQLALVT
jgi:general stress protein CsbA